MAIVRSVRVTNLRETMRAFDQLAAGAQDEMTQSANELARELAVLVQAAGQAEGRQARAAANTVDVFQGKRLPTIRAGAKGSKRDRALVLGSEFGATRKFGWYDPKKHPRYYDSVGKQFKPHRGAASYWFFTTVEANDARIGAKYAEALDRMAMKWGSGG
jgi:hypothetical protein